VAVPGTIKANSVYTGIPEDKQNPAVFYVAYGTSDNPIKDPITKEQDEPTPADLYWSVSTDNGETYHEVTWAKNGGEITEFTDPLDIRTGWPWMAKGDQEQGEVQLRMTPDGSRFYATWLDEGDDGSDIVFRRIMPTDFSANHADTASAIDEETTSEVVSVEEEEAGSIDDFSSDSGGDND